MERIVHGHFADPQSTRDIVGIKPEEFEVIIEALQQLHKTYFAFLAATEEQQVDLIKQVMSTEIDDEIIDIKPGEQEIIRSFDNKNETMIGFYNLSYTILSELNQPYPGAEY